MLIPGRKTAMALTVLGCLGTAAGIYGGVQEGVEAGRAQQAIEDRTEVPMQTGHEYVIMAYGPYKQFAPGCIVYPRSRTEADDWTSRATAYEQIHPSGDINALSQPYKAEYRLQGEDWQIATPVHLADPAKAQKLCEQSYSLGRNLIATEGGRTQLAPIYNYSAPIYLPE